MKERRWKLVALLATGMLIGVVMVGTPAGAHVGSVTHLWNTHIKPKTDARYYTKTQSNTRFLPGGNLPAGKTVRGVFLLGGQAAAAGNAYFGDISYGWRMPSALIEHYISDGAPNPSGCTGSADAPAAAPGHLCVYEDANFNASTSFVAALAGGRYGTRVVAVATAAGYTEIRGTWAATAGASAAPRAARSDASGPTVGS